MKTTSQKLRELPVRMTDRRALDRIIAEVDALWGYTLALMTGPYIGMDREERELILGSELIARLAGDN